MSDINQIDLRLVDTTILLVFLGAMRHRKATTVAAEMGLTQPAVSHALKRLRRLYDDQLFLRRAHGLEPTAFAFELEPKVRRILRLISETLDGPEPFQPGSANFDLRIGAFDYESSGLIPYLIADLQTTAPKVNVHTFPLDNQDALEALVQGQIDLSVGYFDFPTERESSFIYQKLYDETYVIAGRKDHPIFAEPLTLQCIASEQHLLISPRGPRRNLVDHAMALHGLQRQVRTVVPSLLSALPIIETSDQLVVLPKRVAERNADRFQFEFQDVPIDGGSFELHAVRHVRNARNPFHIWLEATLSRLLTGQRTPRVSKK